MSESRPTELVGLAAAGVAVCCGLPILLGAGLLTATVGLAVGSTLVVVAGITLGVLGLLRRRRRRACETVAPSSPEPRGGR
jgi:hypothetical protein